MTVTQYEVVWGIEESDRITYPTDLDDVMPEGGKALARASRKLLEFANARHRAGLYADGRCVAGNNVSAALWAIANGRALWEAAGSPRPSSDPPAPQGSRWTGTGAHRTRTIERVTNHRHDARGVYVNTKHAKAECLCGWSEPAADRTEARWRAKKHRETAAS
ncbi:hypothetical protein SAMN05421776_11780 [Nocardia farcinica]|uniref:Uncharacterized protein n=1 Tax=Nocardia farcinica TaxID=37329 RepID=A0A0H5NVN9_NOCFR|nr:hypothetical protein [Nocardia farcinica]AXK86583.1 hypothetical protein DXT66_13950 [Nocardia farcinica]PFW99082.1 hypothetical protein CJ469_05688 [Nocardia farcinica]PFX06120.1 hypothetical protein CJ468_04986 [Nocardia farcinica]CRY79870.1 Uncharacterised protein [Nocardia farcinica]SIT33688.1 hypothetical protein SAMN05421776_11780 [Nocardia farcinica]